MNESTIKPVSGVTSDTNFAPSVVQSVASTPSAAPTSQVAPASSEKTQPAEKASQSLPLSNLEDVSLRFRVNEDTNEITVYVIDRSSRKILRTVPPEEFTKLQAGDLFQLTA